MYCGEGTCTKNSTYKHTCQCNPGRNNLLNISAFPCYSECKKFILIFSSSFYLKLFLEQILLMIIYIYIWCSGALGSDCARLGIRVANTSSSTQNSSNDGSSPGEIHTP